MILPISGTKYEFQGSDKWLHGLAHKDYFTVRRGTIKFRGYVPRHAPIGTEQPQDADFKPTFEQKGVDMRIGLDMAIFANTRAVDVIAHATNDTDCISAMKHARRSGIQIALIEFANCKPCKELLGHADFKRGIAWPSP